MVRQTQPLRVPFGLVGGLTLGGPPNGLLQLPQTILQRHQGWAQYFREGGEPARINAHHDLLPFAGHINEFLVAALRAQLAGAPGGHVERGHPDFRGGH